jgi:rhamnulose-1-phosphate aldolase
MKDCAGPEEGRRQAGESAMSGVIEQSWFVGEMGKVTGDMWLKGWDERNAGNMSLRLTAEDLSPYAEALNGERVFRLRTAVPELAGEHYLVTGAGKFFRNVASDPAGNLGILRVAGDGGSVAVLWGLRGDAGPTSELTAHLHSHLARQRASSGKSRVIAHCHATNLIALSHVLPLDGAIFTRALWEMCTECLVVFPDGLAVLPWMVPGTLEIGEATAEAMRGQSIVLWPFHGVFSAGNSLEDAFSLIDTAEKAAEILVKVLAMGGARQSVSSGDLERIAKHYGLTPMAEAMELEGWSAPAGQLSDARD